MAEPSFKLLYNYNIQYKCPSSYAVVVTVVIVVLLRVGVYP